MFDIINNGAIVINRVDSAEAPLFINQGDKIRPIRYSLEEGEKVYLGVMEPNKKFEDAIIRKVFTKSDCNEFGDIVIKFEPNDTVNLIPGKYYYQIKASLFDTKGNNIVNTVVSKREFFIED